MFLHIVGICSTDTTEAVRNMPVRGLPDPQVRCWLAFHPELSNNGVREEVTQQARKRLLCVLLRFIPFTFFQICNLNSQ